MELPRAQDGTITVDSSIQKAAKKERRHKSKGHDSAKSKSVESPRDESERSGAKDGSKRRRHKSKTGTRKHHDSLVEQVGASMSSPEPVESSSAVSPAAPEEQKEAESRGGPKSQPQSSREAESRTRDASKELVLQEQRQQPQGQTQGEGTKPLETQDRPRLPIEPKQKDAVSAVGDLTLNPSPTAILVVFLFTVGGVAFSVLVFQAFPRPQRRCLTPACDGVLNYMEAIVDKHMNPCHNFYRHVCGHWLRNTTAQIPSSFMADAFLNYTSRRHQLMMARVSGSQPADMVSRYYGTCVAYLGVPRTVREIVSKVLEVSGTSQQSWINMTTGQAFSKLLQLSFLYRLHSLFRITTGIIENRAYIAVDRANSFKQRLPSMGRNSHGNSYLTAVLKAIGEEGFTDTTITSCLALDDTIGFNETLRETLRSPLVPASEADCAEFPPSKWIEGANSQNEMKLPTDIYVLARNFIATCSNLKSVLMHKTAPVKAVYSIALLTVDFLKLDFTLTATSTKLEQELVQKTCHDDTMATFKRIWLPALSEVLSISQTSAQEISGYFSTLQKVIDEEGVTHPKWMSTKDRITALAKAKEMRVSTFSTGNLSKEELDHSRYNPSFGMSSNDWIYNKANVLRRFKVPDDVDEDVTLFVNEDNNSNVEAQLLADSTTNTLVVPHMFAVPPVFFDDIPAGSYANLAMQGFHIARKVMSQMLNIRTTSPWSSDTASNYAEARSCYANSSSAFHGHLSDAQFDEAAAAAYAMRVVFRVGSFAVIGASKSEAPFFSTQLFFRRACLSLCAGGKSRADINSVDQDTASAACTLAVSTMAEFHQTFGCSSSDQMAIPRRCNI